MHSRKFMSTNTVNNYKMNQIDIKYEGTEERNIEI